MIRTNIQDTLTIPLLTGTSWLHDANWMKLNVTSSKETFHAYNATNTGIKNILGGENQRYVLKITVKILYYMMIAKN